MENEIKSQKDYFLPASILVSTMIFAGAWVYSAGLKYQQDSAQVQLPDEFGPEQLLPQQTILPVRWGDLGVKMINAGVIDAEKFESLYLERGGLTEEMKELLYGSKNGNLAITEENSGFLLNLLWALGLGNKNEILEKGPMTTYDGGKAGLPAEALAKAGNFASTGGWIIAQGEAMDHYSRHFFMALTEDQQKLVERVSKNIYRPCCNNPTYFPDCNHGMAMLGLLELMASQGISEEEMYRVALQVNSYWFPDTYLTIASYLKQRGIDWQDADPKQILGADFSSASGYKKILSQIQPVQQSGGGGCGV